MTSFMEDMQPHGFQIGTGGDGLFKLQLEIEKIDEYNSELKVGTLDG